MLKRSNSQDSDDEAFDEAIRLIDNEIRRDNDNSIPNRNTRRRRLISKEDDAEFDTENTSIDELQQTKKSISYNSNNHELVFDENLEEVQSSMKLNLEEVLIHENSQPHRINEIMEVFSSKECSDVVKKLLDNRNKKKISESELRAILDANKIAKADVLNNIDSISNILKKHFGEGRTMILGSSTYKEFKEKLKDNIEYNDKDHYNEKTSSEVYHEMTEIEVICTVHHKMEEHIAGNKTDDVKEISKKFKHLKQAISRSCRNFFKRLFNNIFKDFDEEEEEEEGEGEGEKDENKTLVNNNEQGSQNDEVTNKKKKKKKESVTSQGDKSSSSAKEKDTHLQKNASSSGSNINKSKSKVSSEDGDLVMHDADELQFVTKFLDNYFNTGLNQLNEYKFRVDYNEQAIYGKVSLGNANFFQMCLNQAKFPIPDHISCIIGDVQLYLLIISFILNSSPLYCKMKTVTFLWPQGINIDEFVEIIENSLNNGLKPQKWIHYNKVQFETSYNDKTITDTRKLILFYSTNYYKISNNGLNLENLFADSSSSFTDSTDYHKHINTKINGFMKDKDLCNTPSGSHSTNFKTLYKLLMVIKPDREHDIWWEIGHGIPYMAIYISMFTNLVVANDIPIVSEYVNKILSNLQQTTKDGILQI
jgi:hypothetical protein